MDQACDSMPHEAADDRTVEARLRTAIDTATRTAAYVDYRQAAGWRTGADAVLHAIANIASGLRAGIALKLVEHGCRLKA
jgi:hypothetical protein